MAHSKKSWSFLLVLAGFAMLVGLIFPLLTQAFPLWLDAPARTNNNDPKNTSVPHFFATPTPQATNTPVNTHTASPTISPTFTNSPAWSATASPTVSQTPTAVPTHGSLVTDFENNSANDRTYWNGGGVFTAKDNLGSTISPYLWTASSAVTPGSGGSGYAANLSGTVLTQNNSTGFYPYVFFATELIPGGAAPYNSGGVDTNVLPYSPNHGLQFDYKAGAAGVLYQVELISTTVHDFGYYQFQFTPADTNWHTQVIYFPDITTVPNIFTQPGWAATVAFDPTKVGAVMFKPVALTTGPVNYNITLDNITFAVPAAPTPVPTPTFSTGTVVMDFENHSSDNIDNAPFSQGLSTNKDSNGSTVFPNPWAAGSGTAPGAYNASSYAGCINGTLVQQVPASNIYPFTDLEMLLAANGWPNGGGSVDITSYAPNKRLIFDYQVTDTTVQYWVQIVTSNITDYGFYQYQFSAPNTNWNTLTVYFPGASFSPNFSQPSWAAPKPWDATKAGDIIFKPVPSNNGPVNYNICVDNIRFD